MTNNYPVKENSMWLKPFPGLREFRKDNLSEKLSWCRHVNLTHRGSRPRTKWASAREKLFYNVIQRTNKVSKEIESQKDNVLAACLNCDQD